MPTATLTQVASVAGLSIQSALARTASSQISHESTPPLPAAKAGSLSTRTDDNTGVVTLAAGHGLEMGDVVDVYWAGAGNYRYGMDVTAVNGNDVTVDGGAGANLPAQDTAVTVGEQVTIDTDFDGDLVKLIVANCSLRAHIAFRDATPTVLKEVELQANEAWSWVAGQGIANPLAGSPVNDIKASNGDASGTATLRIGVLYDGQS